MRKAGCLLSDCTPLRVECKHVDMHTAAEADRLTAIIERDGVDAATARQYARAILTTPEIDAERRSIVRDEAGVIIYRLPVEARETENLPPRT